MDIEIQGKTDLEKLRTALDITGSEVREWTRDASEEQAEILAEVGRRNLASRGDERGEHYTRGVAEVHVESSGDEFFTALSTPWLGMEFGGEWNAHGTGWRKADSQAGAPMWAPWHKTSTQGYIIGEASHALTDSGRLDEAVADRVLGEIVAVMDSLGLDR